MIHQIVLVSFPHRFEDAVCALLDSLGVSQYSIERRGINTPVWDDAFDYSVPPDSPVVLTLAAQEGQIVAPLIGELVGTQLVEVRQSVYDDGQVEGEYRSFYAPLRLTEKLELRPHWMELDPDFKGLVIRTEPGGLFGTGLHGTTRDSLRLAQEAVKAGMKVLDAGSGSGILAVAALMMGASRATCVEIDKRAVEATQELARLNRVSDDRYEVRVADILRLPLDIAAFDLIFFNIGPRITREFFAQQGTRLSSHARIVLSGITTWSEEETLEVFSRLGRKSIQRLCEDGEWVSIIL